MRAWLVILLLGLAAPLCARTELFPVPVELTARPRVPPPPPARQPEDLDTNTGRTGSVGIGLWVHPLFTSIGISPSGLYFGLGFEVAVRMVGELFAINRLGLFASPFSDRPDRLPPLPPAIGGSPGPPDTSAGYIFATGVRWRLANWRHGSFFIDGAGCFAHFAGSAGYRGTNSFGGEFFFGVELGSDTFRFVIETGFHILVGLTPTMDRGYLDGGEQFAAEGAILTYCRVAFRFYFCR